MTHCWRRVGRRETDVIIFKLVTRTDEIVSKNRGTMIHCRHRARGWNGCNAVVRMQHSSKLFSWLLIRKEIFFGFFGPWAGLDFFLFVARPPRTWVCRKIHECEIKHVRDPGIPFYPCILLRSSTSVNARRTLLGVLARFVPYTGPKRGHPYLASSIGLRTTVAGVLIWLQGLESYYVVYH